MSLDLEAVRMFIKVAELGSFTRSAAQLGTTKSRVSLRIQALESALGSRLLQRTTRTVRLTPDGEQFLERAKRLVLDLDELSGMFQAPSALKGRVRIDLPVGFARTLIIPRLREFLALHPQLEVLVSSTDRRVEVVREGFDCVLSVGPLSASGLLARKLGALAMASCASPAYLKKHGMPRDIADLDRHYLVNYSQQLGAEPATFEYFDGQRYRHKPMRSFVTVNNSDAYSAACLAGLGLIQAPRYGATNYFASGELVEVLADFPSEPMPVSLVHGHGRNVPRPVRAIMSWITQLMEPHVIQA